MFIYYIGYKQGDDKMIGSNQQQQTSLLIKKKDNSQHSDKTRLKPQHGDDDKTASKSKLVVKKTKEKEEISKGLQYRIDVANRAANTAEEKILEAYKYAIEVDRYSKPKALKVLYERLNYSPQWIRKKLPQEAKQMSKARTNQAHRKKTIHKIGKGKSERKFIELPSGALLQEAIILEKPADGSGGTGTGRKIRQELITMPPQKEEIPKVKGLSDSHAHMHTIGIVIPNERVKRFYTEILKIRERAEKEGLIVNVDGTVKVLGA